MKSLFCLAAMFGLMGLLNGGCTTSPDTDAGKTNLNDDSTNALRQLETTDPSLNDFVKHAYGYAIFPSVGKGAVGVGGAYGKGTVYANGDMIGFADLSQATIGAQLGGQTYSRHWKTLRATITPLMPKPRPSRPKRAHPTRHATATASPSSRCPRAA